MSNLDNLDTVLLHVSDFLSQKDLIALSLTCRSVHDRVAIPQLYKSVVIVKEPVLECDQSLFNSHGTYLFGYNETVKTCDQNDLFLYDKIQRLTASPYLHHIKNLTISQNVFNDVENGFTVLLELVLKIIGFDRLHSLQIFDSILLDAVYDSYCKLSNLHSLKLRSLDDIMRVNLTSVTALTLDISKLFECPEEILNELKVRDFLENRLEKLTLFDKKQLSLSFLQNLLDCDIVCQNLKALKFEHLHGAHSFNMALYMLDATPIIRVTNPNQLNKLEMAVACEEKDCNCLDEFFAFCSKNLPAIQKLALIENTIVTRGNHYTEENWDVSVGKFLVELSKNYNTLTSLSVRHNPNFNGEQDDSVDGNYFRRRDLYNMILPHLTNLKFLSSPSILLALSSYDILIGDLLWNGCECEYCKQVLPVLDTYIMNHQHFSQNEGRYRDVSVTNFFAYVNDVLNKRFRPQIEWDLDIWTATPTKNLWNFHGYSEINHFRDFDCKYDEFAFTVVPTACAHFFNGYMENIVKMLPKLQAACLSGIYYKCGDTERGYEPVFDNETV